MALARALINQPRVLLLDEPLGALDLKLREEMQIELKSLQRRLGITFVFVTHDQGEALSMSDRVAVFNAGGSSRSPRPRELYTRPAHRLRGALRWRRQRGSKARWRSGSRGAPQPFAVRPENVVCCAVTSRAAGPMSAEGAVLDVQYHGATSRWQVRSTMARCSATALGDRGRRRIRCRASACAWWAAAHRAARWPRR